MPNPRPVFPARQWPIGSATYDRLRVSTCAHIDLSAYYDTRAGRFYALATVRAGGRKLAYRDTFTLCPLTDTLVQSIIPASASPVFLTRGNAASLNAIHRGLLAITRLIPIGKFRTRSIVAHYIRAGDSDILLQFKNTFKAPARTNRENRSKGAD